MAMMMMNLWQLYQLKYDHQNVISLCTHLATHTDFALVACYKRVLFKLALIIPFCYFSVTIK